MRKRKSDILEFREFKGVDDSLPKNKTKQNKITKK